MNRLPFIVVLGAGESGLLRQRLGGFVGFEAAEELLFALGFGGLAQAAIAEHQIVVRLEIFGVDSQRLLERADGVGVAALQEEHAAVLVHDDAVARILAANVGETGEGGVVIAGGFLGQRQEEFGAGELRRERERLLQVRAGGFGLAFLNERARDVHEAIGIRRLGLHHALEAVLGALEVALQEEADAPVIPALAVLLADDGLPLGVRRAARRTVAAATVVMGMRGDGLGVEGVLAAVEGDAGGTGFGDAGERELREIVGELAVVQAGFEGDGAFGVARDVEQVMDGVGGAGRDQADVERAARLPGVALVDGVALGIDEERAIEVGALIDGTAAVVVDAAAPGEEAAFGVAGGELEPDVEAVDGAAGEEVADFAGAHDGIDADGAAGREADARRRRAGAAILPTSRMVTGPDCSASSPTAKVEARAGASVARRSVSAAVGCSTARRRRGRR